MTALAPSGLGQELNTMEKSGLDWKQHKEEADERLQEGVWLFFAWPGRCCDSGVFGQGFWPC